MPRERSRKTWATILVVIAAGVEQGCGSEIPATTSPITSADSEAGRKARAEDERLVKERQEQEARARRRIRGLPVEG